MTIEDGRKQELEQYKKEFDEEFAEEYGDLTPDNLFKYIKDNNLEQEQRIDTFKNRNGKHLPIIQYHLENTDFGKLHRTKQDQISAALANVWGATEDAELDQKLLTED